MSKRTDLYTIKRTAEEIGFSSNYIEKLRSEGLLELNYHFFRPFGGKKTLILYSVSAIQELLYEKSLQNDHCLNEVSLAVESDTTDVQKKENDRGRELVETLISASK